MIVAGSAPKTQCRSGLPAKKLKVRKKTWYKGKKRNTERDLSEWRVHLTLWISHRLCILGRLCCSREMCGFYCSFHTSPWFLTSVFMCELRGKREGEGVGVWLPCVLHNDPHLTLETGLALVSKPNPGLERLSSLCVLQAGPTAKSTLLCHYIKPTLILHWAAPDRYSSNAVHL